MFTNAVCDSQVDRGARLGYFESRQWYAVYTRSRHEKQVAQRLLQKSLPCFLPLKPAVHRWKNAEAVVELPLFPSYLFVRISLQERLRVLEVPGVVSLVGVAGCPTAVPDREIEGMRIALASGETIVDHPELISGARVQIKQGPFRGIEGVLLRKSGKVRVVISVSAIMRSIAIEVKASDVDMRRFGEAGKIAARA